MSVFIPGVRQSIKKAMMETEKMGNSPGWPHRTEKWNQREHKTCLKATNEIITSIQSQDQARQDLCIVFLLVAP